MGGESVAYWFMRMKQGSEGEENFAPKLWNRNLIGVMFGTWTIDDVLTNGAIDEGKVTYEHLSKYRTKNEPVFKKSWFDSSRRFLIEMASDDKVVVEFGGALHIATVTDTFGGNPSQLRPKYGEHFN